MNPEPNPDFVQFRAEIAHALKTIEWQINRDCGSEWLADQIATKIWPCLCLSSANTKHALECALRWLTIAKMDGTPSCEEVAKRNHQVVARHKQTCTLCETVTLVQDALKD